MIINSKKSILTYKSNVPGKNIVIMAGIHGNEHSGILALQRIIQEGINLRKGKLTIIFANIHAIAQNIRFVDINMNRYFGKDGGHTYEGKRIQKIIEYLNRADILLDLHNTIDLSSAPFLISNNNEYTKLFDVQNIVDGLDQLHQGGSDGYMNSRGKVGLCLECGSITDNIDSTTQYAYNMTLNFLRYLGMIDGEYQLYTHNKKTITTKMIYISIHKETKLAKPFHEFESCSKGQIIAYDGDNKVVAPYDGYIIFARNVFKEGSECFVYGV